MAREAIDEHVFIDCLDGRVDFLVFGSVRPLALESSSSWMISAWSDETDFLISPMHPGVTDQHRLRQAGLSNTLAPAL